MAMDYVWSWTDYVFYGMCSCGSSAVTFDPVNKLQMDSLPHLTSYRFVIIANYRFVIIVNKHSLHNRM
ncbi:Uncharacterized protein BM_BM13017 [Brugia malayi]|uniref:Bm13017 n=1 Tax=Brugia malayi TaxID=6279 RepID=A0A0J9YFV3_BRUMA|nr:Uncharacterized protein BM_BM13017 [Brugia malayi]CDQ08431.1 Bm13017 [Brugia malayi]VIO94723.1 Uncharacterized protein BM_BM13017 [Brugia malayi]